MGINFKTFFFLMGAVLMAMIVSEAILVKWDEIKALKE